MEKNYGYSTSGLFKISFQSVFNLVIDSVRYFVKRGAWNTEKNPSQAFSPEVARKNLMSLRDPTGEEENPLDWSQLTMCDRDKGYLNC